MSETVEILEKHAKKEISDDIFLRNFGSAEVYYSTPYGDLKDGSKRLFLLPVRDGTGYHPVFSSVERLREFYDKVGRVGYMCMKGSFVSVLETTNGMNAGAPIKMGIVIDPGYYNITLNASVLDTVINMTK